ncbi:MAG: methylmalonyl-CoA epimerase [Thermotogae bacterium]|nr:methylmalonyl-CoA epimerase [Thermotogota bacterium]
MGSVQIDHIGIAVHTLESATAFYKDVLGLNQIETEILEERKLKIAMIPIGESRIELLEPMEGEEAVSTFLKKRGEGIHHIAFLVADLDGLLKRAVESGIRVIGKPSIGAGGKRVAFLHPKDVSGVLVELVEQPKTVEEG